MARHGRSFLFRAVVKNPFRLAAGAGANAAGATVEFNTTLIAGTATGAASAAAVTISEAAALVSGTATGAANAAAVTVTEQGSLTAAAATGAATTAAATVTLNTSAISGAATGAAVGAAATVTEATSLVAGAATGAATGAAATVSLNTSLIAGAENGAASAAGATVSEAFALTAGAASGGGVGTASGATVTETTALSVGVGPGAIPAGFPNAATTGVRSGVTLTASGNITVTTANTVISALDVTGTIRIEANNVTVRDCRIQGFAFYGVIVPEEYTGSIIEYCDIIGSGTDNCIGAGGTIQYNDLSGCENGISIFGACLIENNYIHDLAGGAGAHFDGIQVGGGTGYTIRHNTVINQFAQTTAIMINSDFGPITGITVDNNFISGGGYTIQVEGIASVTNNIIRSGIFGWANVTGTNVTWTNNIDAASWRYVDGGNALGANAPRATGEALATGATVTEAASLIAGSASAGGTGTASGVTVSLAASLTAGTATGAASRAGATVTEAVSFIAGSASSGTATQAAVAPPVRASFDQMTVRMDSTVVTFDQESTRVLPWAKFSLVPGAAAATVAAQGVLLAETVSFIAGAAVVDTAPVVAGATVSTVTTLLAGAASSTEPVTVSGATLTLGAALIAGAATGGVATSPGITWDKTTPTWDTTEVTFDATTGAGAPAAGIIGQPTYSFIPGTATGMVVAAGVTFQIRASFMASPANVGNQPATAQGKTFTATLSLAPGAARGQGWSVLPEGGSTWTTVAEPGDGWTVVPRPSGTWDKAA